MHRNQTKDEIWSAVIVLTLAPAQEALIIVQLKLKKKHEKKIAFISFLFPS